MENKVEKNEFYGVAGFPVMHSRSPELFSAFSGGKINYGRFSAATEDELRMFLNHFPLKGLNITSPLKEAALKLAHESDETARATGAANCLVNEKGRWKAFNTDYSAVRALIRKSGVSKGSRVLIAGAGGAGKAAITAALHQGLDVTLTNRTLIRGEETALSMKVPLVSWGSSWESYDLLISALPRQADPLGDHPEFHGKVIDAAYPRSKTTLRGLKRGLKTVSGEEWLIEQGRSSYALMTRSEPLGITWEKAVSCFQEFSSPLVLTGFMGSGKSSVAQVLQKSGLTVFSTDAEMEKRTGLDCHEAFSTLGEGEFRNLEKEILREGGFVSSDVIDSGGGLWIDPENRRMLPEKALVIYLWTTPETAALRAYDRPLLKGKSQTEACALYKARLAHYFTHSALIIPAELLSPREAAKRAVEERADAAKGGDEIDG